MILERKDGKWQLDTLNSLVKTSKFIYQLPEGKLLFAYRRGGAEIRDEKAINSISSLKLADYIITDVLQDREGLWLATHSGLIVANFSLEKNDRIKIPAELQGIMLYSIEKDSRGYLWLGSNFGLFMFDPKSGRIRNFTQFHGLQCNEFNTHASVVNTHGQMIFGGVKGLNIFNPLDFEFEDVRRKLVVEELKNQSRSILHSGVLGHGLKLIEDQVSIYLRVLVLGGSLSERTEFAYALVEDGDVVWNDMGRNRDIIIQSVSSGAYKLLVKYRSDDGQWSEPKEVLSLVVRPLMYRTWWFWTLVSLCILAIVVYVLQIRALREKEKALAEVKREHALNEMRQQISRDLHDDLGSGITRLTLLARQMEMSEKDQQPIHKIAEMGSELSKSLREVIWSTNPALDNTGSLVRTALEYCTETLRMAGIEAHVEVKGLEYNMDISPIHRQHIWMIIKESVQNVLKHSGAKQVEINIRQRANEFYYSIRDNGVGFETDELSVMRNGLRNMRSRAKEINAELHMESVPGNFTLVELKLFLS